MDHSRINQVFIKIVINEMNYFKILIALLVLFEHRSATSYKISFLFDKSTFLFWKTIKSYALIDQLAFKAPGNSHKKYDSETYVSGDYWGILNNPEPKSSLWKGKLDGNGKVEYKDKSVIKLKSVGDDVAVSEEFEFDITCKEKEVADFEVDLVIESSDFVVRLNPFCTPTIETKKDEEKKEEKKTEEAKSGDKKTEEKKPEEKKPEEVKEVEKKVEPPKVDKTPEKSDEEKNKGDTSEERNLRDLESSNWNLKYLSVV